MPLDPSIPLGVTAAPPAGLMSGLNNVLPTLGAINQARLFQQSFAARQRAGEIMSSAPDLDTGLQQLTKDPQVTGYLPEVIQSLRGAQQTLVDTQGRMATQSRDAVHAFLQSATGALADPSQLGAITESNMQTLPRELRERVAPAIASLQKGLLSSLPTDPLQARMTYNNRLVGLLVGAGIEPGKLDAIMGTPATQDLGGSIASGVQLPPQLGGGFAPATALGKTLAPQVVDATVGPNGEKAPLVVGGGLGLPGPGQGPPGQGPGNSLMPARPGPSAPSPAGTAGPAGMIGQPSPGAQSGKYLTDRGADMAQYQKDLDSNTKVGGLIMQTLTEAREAATKFKPGGGANVYTALGQFAQAIGADQKLVDKIANGDLAASQEFTKLMVNTTMGQIREQLSGVGASRLSQMEFQTFQHNNPNISTDPRAIEKIFNFWTRLYGRDHAEQIELNRFLGQGGNISEWPSRWQDMAQQRGFIRPEETNTAGRGATVRYNPASGKLEPIGPAGAGP